MFIPDDGTHSWGAAMAAGHYKLDNLCAIVDHNGLQIDGRNEDVMNVMPIAEKFAVFGWNVLEIDGHVTQSSGKHFALNAELLEE